MVINKVVNSDKIFHGYISHGVYLGHLFFGLFLLVSMFVLFEKGPLFSVINVTVLLLTNILSYCFKEALRLLFQDVISVFNLVFVVSSFLVLTHVEILPNIHYLLVYFILYWALDFYCLYQLNGKNIKKNIKKASSEKGFDYMLKEDLRRNTNIEFSIIHKMAIIFFIAFFMFSLVGEGIRFPFWVEEKDLDGLNIVLIAFLMSILMGLVSFLNVLHLYFIEFYLLVNYKNK